eukprot:CAMPEP_0196593860 /NCGR_PEP_ID=MMETSP1081-20130531/76806_1 /TAXON_ID=36882 /ORGANISM="Pyramimonas amylifera, Strain CCMP720" /LENGTH=41 /DNA_ID= /DNA_START= /DNA_END= /DNA_ORIENTATION=
MVQVCFASCERHVPSVVGTLSAQKRNLSAVSGVGSTTDKED